MTTAEIITQAQPAYVAEKKCTFKPKQYSKPGIYCIIEDAVIVYVGMSYQNCYKACYRHFQKWTDRRNRHRATYSPNGIKVFMQIMSTDMACNIECQLIQELMPRDNREFYHHHIKRENRSFSKVEIPDDMPF